MSAMWAFDIDAARDLAYETLEEPGCWQRPQRELDLAAAVANLIPLATSTTTTSVVPEKPDGGVR